MTDKEREIAEYARYMFDRGDYLSNIRKYIKSETDDEAFFNQLMTKLERLNKDRNTRVADSPIIHQKSNVGWFSFAMGILLIISALYVHFAMKAEGLIGTLPLILFGLGITALFGKLKY